MIYNGTPQMIYEQFDTLHGASGPGVLIGHWLVFPNGARRATDGVGPLLEPPEKPFDRLCVQEQYHRALFARALKKFDHLKRELIVQHAHTAESLWETNQQRLKDLRDEVRRHKANLEQVQLQKTNNDPRPWMRPRTEEQIIAENTSRGKLDDYKQALQSVEI
jgi:hypothetical protein